MTGLESKPRIQSSVLYQPTLQVAMGSGSRGLGMLAALYFSVSSKGLQGLTTVSATGPLVIS